MQTAPGMCALVELQLGPDVNDEGAVALVGVDLARGQWMGFDALAQQRSAIERDDVLEVRRLRSERGRGLLDELLLVGDGEQLLVGSLVADRRGDLHVRSWAAAQRPAEVTRPDLARIRQCEQLPLQRVEDAAGALLLVDREVGAGDVSDEQRVAGQRGPGFRAASGVGERECRVLGAVTGGGHSVHVDRAEFEFPAVGERLVLVVGARLLVDVDGGAGSRGQAAVT